MENLRVLARVEDLGEIVESYGNFFKQLKQLKQNGVRLITPRDEAFARLSTKGNEDIGKTYGTRTSAGFEYAPEKLPILRLESRLNDLKLAKLAVEANRADHYLSTGSTKEYEESLRQAEQDKNKSPAERSVIVLPSRDKFTITDKEHWEVLKTILKDQAEQYFNLNGPITVYPIPKDVVDAQNGTILNYMWFSNLDNRSDFNGNSGDLNIDSRARGIVQMSGRPSLIENIYSQIYQIDNLFLAYKKARKGKSKKKKNIKNFSQEIKLIMIESTIVTKAHMRT